MPSRATLDPIVTGARAFHATVSLASCLCIRSRHFHIYAMLLSCYFHIVCPRTQAPKCENNMKPRPGSPKSYFVHISGRIIFTLFSDSVDTLFSSVYIGIIIQLSPTIHLHAPLQSAPHTSCRPGTHEPTRSASHHCPAPRLGHRNHFSLATRQDPCRTLKIHACTQDTAPRISLTSTYVQSFAPGRKT